jgi:hypothetical protein
MLGAAQHRVRRLCRRLKDTARESRMAVGIFNRTVPLLRLFMLGGFGTQPERSRRN